MIVTRLSLQRKLIIKMSSPIYFLAGAVESQLFHPATRALSRELLAKYGLDEALADVTSRDEVYACNLTGKSPTGEAGLLLSANAIGKSLQDRLGFYPESQTWEDFGRCWIGLDRFDPVTPADLQRKGTRVSLDGSALPPYDGYPVALADGHEWEVPIIRRPDGTTKLPRKIAWRKDGKRLELSTRYQAVWDATGEAVQFFMGDAAQGGGRETRDYEWAAGLALAGLALNYRLSGELATALGLLTTANWQQVAEAMIDMPFVYAAIAREQKKTAAAAAEGSPAATTNTAPGSTDSSATIDPAAAS